MPNPTLLQSVLNHLAQGGAAPQHLQHAPAHSSAEFAQRRNAPISLGCKALLMKVGGVFTIAALRSDRRMDNRSFRRALKAQKLRFASRQELLELTGCVPGQLPPIGAPILPFRLVADRTVLSHDRVAFTAGTHTDSIVVNTQHWLALANPELYDFSAPMPEDSP